MTRYQQSLNWLTRARAVTPGGSQTLSKQASRFPEGAFPAFLQRGEGCHVWDLDGHEYIDWILGLGAIGLGYGHPAVIQAVERQLRDGPIFSLPHRLEAEVAEMLCDIIPCAEMVRFVKTGSEATEAAIRVARMATGRDIILTSGYHSWHSWYAATKDQHPGVPAYMRLGASAFAYNDLASLDRAIELASDAAYSVVCNCGQWECGTERMRESGVAAIILEPTLIEPPAPGFLEGVAESAKRADALLIFDEMVTGFRWANGGAQEFYGMTPDLATFGKAMANGFPLACLVGRRDLMEHAWAVSGTFGGDCIALAACQATLSVYREKPVIGHLWEIGGEFIRRFNRLPNAGAVGAKCIGQPPHPKIVFDPDPGDLKMSVFLQETAARGVLFHQAGFNVSFAHDDEDLDRSLTACEAALEIIAEDEKSGTLLLRLEGKPIELGTR